MDIIIKKLLYSLILIQVILFLTYQMILFIGFYSIFIIILIIYFLQKERNPRKWWRFFLGHTIEQGMMSTKGSIDKTSKIFDWLHHNIPYHHYHIDTFNITFRKKEEAVLFKLACTSI